MQYVLLITFEAVNDAYECGLTYSYGNFTKLEVSPCLIIYEQKSSDQRVS